MWRDGLNKHRIIRGESEYLVKQEARLQIAEWDERWANTSVKAAERAMKAEGKRLQEERKLQAVELTATAALKLENLGGLLKATLAIDDRIEWEALKTALPFLRSGPVINQIPWSPRAHGSQENHWPLTPDSFRNWAFWTGDT